MRRIIAISQILGCMIAIATLAEAGTGSDIALNASSRSGSLNTKGIGGAMPAFYDDKIFTINFSEFPKGSEATLLAQNTAVNHIFQSDPGLPGGAPFISVIDAIPGEGAGFNPLWLEVQIAFTAGHTPRQLGSDDEIAAAVASGEITLAPTTELYRCSVIGAAVPPTSGDVTAPSSMSAASVSTPQPAVSSWGAIKALYAH
jgi:hypothetical protein